MDKTLQLETTLRQRMEKMTSRQFERVLHPIFEEDELTLILAGAALGFAAGLVQQGLETGAIQIPNIWEPLRRHIGLFMRAPRKQTKVYLTSTRTKLSSTGRRVRRCLMLPFPKRRERPESDEPTPEDETR